MLQRPVGSSRVSGKASMFPQNKSKSRRSALEKLETRTLLSALIFNSAVNLDVANHPQSVVVADLNGDHKPDLAVANEGSNSISIFLGNGDGTFTTGTTLSTGNQPDCVLAADVNGDGKVDLIVSNYTDHTVSVFLGRGDGTFRSNVRTTVIPGSLGQNSGLTHSAEPIALADVDGDGKLDLVTANGLSATFSVFLGNGDGTFGGIGKQFDTAIAGNQANAFSITVGDVNTSAGLDVVIADPSNSDVQVFQGNGDGTFKPTPTVIVAGVYPSSVYLADLSGDGKLDLVATNKYSQGVTVFAGNGDGTFGAGSFYSTDKFPFSAAIADVNGDGNLDIITANSGKQGTASAVRADVSILPGNGDGTFGPAQNFSAQNYVTSVAVGDFNGDGDPDIVTANAHAYSASVLINAGAAINLNGGDLIVRGTSDVDTGSLSVSGGTLTANIDGLIRNYSAGAVTSIDVDLMQGDDAFTIGANVSAVNLRAGDGADDIIANNSAGDTILGLNGADSITLAAGNNFVNGGRGHDTLIAGSGNDTLLGDLGVDSLVGGSGNDLMKGGFGADTILAGTGNDTIKGNQDGDSIVGGSGNNYINANGGPDTIIGSTGPDDGADTIFGGNGNNSITGTSGNDSVFDGPA